jgi:hypothetical protein
MYGRGLVSVPVSVFAWYFFTRVNSAKTGRLISKIQKFRMRSLSLIESEKSRHTMNDTNSTYRLKQNESAKITRFVGPQYCTLIPYKRQDTTGCSIISWMFSTTRIFCGNIIRYYRYPFGIVAAIPILATAQGAYCLTKFRWNHKNAPYPMSPSRGIVIVSPHDTGSNVSICMDNAHDKDLALDEERRPWWLWNRRQNTNKNEKQIPLSLLVIGDSLAAGVGSRSGTPVLPEAIARSLSKALGGRPVFWTCHGEYCRSETIVLYQSRSVQLIDAQ